MAMMMSPATKGLLYAGCIFNVLGLIVAAWAATAGRMGAMGWVLAVIQLLLAIGFIYFAEGRRSMVSAQRNQWWVSPSPCRVAPEGLSGWGRTKRSDQHLARPS